VVHLSKKRREIKRGNRRTIAGDDDTRMRQSSRTKKEKELKSELLDESGVEREPLLPPDEERGTRKEGGRVGGKGEAGRSIAEERKSFGQTREFHVIRKGID